MDTTDIAGQCPWLYRISPFGIGTCHVESLTGYIARVAHAHLVTPYALLHRGLKWWEANQPENIGRWTRYTGTLRLQATINAQASGQKWVSMLEKVGGVAGLAGCTIADWTHLFPTRGLLKTHHAWCPQCFAEDGDKIYDRLLWSLQSTKACPRHRCRLVQSCPNCGSQIPVIHARSVPGLCPRCEASLVVDDRNSLPVDERDLGLSQIAADFLEDVATRRELAALPKWDAAIVLGSCMRAASIRDAGELAALLNISRITTWYWLQGRAAPDFDHTLRICYLFNLSLTEVLLGRVPKTISARGNGELALRPTRRVPCKFNEVSVAGEIAVFRAQCADSPPSLADVGREVGFAVRILRRHFPATCREISMAHRVRCRELVEARRAAQKQAFRVAIAQCRALRANLTRADVFLVA